MRELLKKTALSAAVGLALGMLVGLVFIGIEGFGSFYERSGVGRTAVYLLLCGLIGAVNVGATIIYSLERWGLLRCTLTHFTIVMTTLCGIGFPQGWFHLRDPLTRWVLATCVVAYFVIWMVNYMIFKRHIRQINEALRDWKDGQTD